jgi:hypothetical protein
MDLFFSNCVPKAKEQKTYSVAEALQHIFSTSSLHGDVELVVNGKAFAKINVDARGAATYRFKTVSGIAVVAEVFYAQARRKLVGSSCEFIGPPLSLLSLIHI